MDPTTGPDPGRHRLPFPYSSGINGSKHAHMRELRVQSGGRPLRGFYAFDPRRSAILLIGGHNTGEHPFYERMVPTADPTYDSHIDGVRKAGMVTTIEIGTSA